MDRQTLALALATPVIIATASLLVVYAIRYLDIIEREPKRFVLAGVLAGCLSTVPSIIAQLCLVLGLARMGVQEHHVDYINTIIGAPITEEIFKGLSVLIFASVFRRRLDSLMDFLVYACAVGTGFELIENLLYQFGTFDHEDVVASWWNMLTNRVIQGGGLHAFFSVWIGLSVWLLFRGRSRKSSLLSTMSFLIAVFLHSMNNAASVMTQLGPDDEILQINYFGQAVYGASNGIDVALFIGLVGYAAVRDLHYLGDFGLKINSKVKKSSRACEVIREMMDPFNHLLAYSKWTWALNTRKRKRTLNRDSIKQFGWLALKYGEIGVSSSYLDREIQTDLAARGVGIVEATCLPLGSEEENM